MMHDVRPTTESLPFDTVVVQIPGYESKFEIAEAPNGA